MALGGLAGLLAGAGQGLGQADEQRRRDQIQQQEAAARLLLLRAQLQNLGPQNFQSLGDTGDPFASSLGGGAPAAPTSGPASLLPSASASMVPGGALTGATTGAADPRGVIPLIRADAQKYGIDPNVATKVFSSEGVSNPVGDNGTSFGAPQLHVGGGMGDEFKRDTGLDPSNYQQNEPQIIDYALKRASQGGWGPWSGARNQGITGFMGINRGGAGGGQAAPQPPGGDAQSPQATPAQYSPGQQQGMQAIAQLNQQLQGANQKLTSEFTQRMQQARTPQERQFLQQDLARKRQELMTLYSSTKQQIVSGEQEAKSQAAQTRRAEDTDRRAEERETKQGWDIYGDAGNNNKEIEYNKRTGQARTLDGQPYKLKGDLLPLSQTSRKSEQNVIVTGPDGKKVYKGGALISADGKFTKPNGEPLPEGDVTFTGKGEGAGRLSETQTRRLTLGSNQVALALNNLSKMPKGATLGAFGGLEQEKGADLSGALKRTLANQITTQDSQLMFAITRGVARGLATVEGAGAATGLKGLADQMEGDLPREGDTGLVVATKMADMRQIVEGAMEVMKNDPSIPEGMHPEFDKILERVRAAVPYTVEQVIALSRDPSAETMADFAKSLGLGEQASPIQDQAGGNKTSTGVQWSIVPR